MSMTQAIPPFLSEWLQTSGLSEKASEEIVEEHGDLQSIRDEELAERLLWIETVMRSAYRAGEDEGLSPNWLARTVTLSHVVSALPMKGVADPLYLDRFGIVQEVNRQFLHPIGMHLTMKRHTNMSGDLMFMSIGGIVDRRDRYEAGIAFSPAAKARKDFPSKTERVRALQSAYAAQRLQTYGWVVQPTTEREPVEVGA